eukprot:CAMPEP_0171916312 /NCGR_PEP_ID=MMETSP0993-20121228/14764_1 /TAXON_ID=483369 /ORGANISM="non described non described, Strain CCMP2098" /LENGTH=56 /DNA_ID=CAMNT_0012551671 /DNA_START=172 /DNA_END=338 /DNA_ORIENTATION=-
MVEIRQQQQQQQQKKHRQEVHGRSPQPLQAASNGMTPETASAPDEPRPPTHFRLRS